MPITRRSALLGAVVAVLATSSHATSESSDPLYIMITEVIGAGDVGSLETIATVDIEAPDYGILGLDAFRRASIAAHQ